MSVDSERVGVSCGVWYRRYAYSHLPCTLPLDHHERYIRRCEAFSKCKYRRHYCAVLLQTYQLSAYIPNVNRALPILTTHKCVMCSGNEDSYNADGTYHASRLTTSPIRLVPFPHCTVLLLTRRSVRASWTPTDQILCYLVQRVDGVNKGLRPLRNRRAPSEQMHGMSR